MSKPEVLERMIHYCGENICLQLLQKSLEIFDKSDIVIAKSLLARAYLSCLNLDGKYIFQAVELFFEVKDRKGILDCINIARNYKNFLALRFIANLSDEYYVTVFAEQSEEELFLSFGIIWFDIYFDHVTNEKNSIAFVDECDLKIIKLYLDKLENSENFWGNIFSRLKDDSSISEARRELLKKLAKGEEVVYYFSQKRNERRKAFSSWADINDIEIIRDLQIGRLDPYQQSDIYLIRDSDAMFKVMKEELDHRTGPLWYSYRNESDLYRQANDGKRLARYFGKDDVAGDTYLRLSFEYGYTLKEYIVDKRFRETEVAYIVSSIADHLIDLLKNGILYLDLKPANIMLVNGQVKLIDLGMSCRIESREEMLPIYLSEPFYAAPENVSSFIASEKSLVYQLGLILYQLSFGAHWSHFICETEDREEKILSVPWFLSQGGVTDKLTGKYEFYQRMLDIDPYKRPSLEEVRDYFQECVISLPKFNKQAQKRKKEKNSVLFPARMGLPHKGHIDFMSRILKLGYYLIISIQRSYTLTDRDPLPKWITMKIIAQSLFDQGFQVSDFEFRLTSYYGSDQEHRMHFAMMPGMSDVIHVASGNESVNQLFPNLDIISQRDIFASEDEDYDNRSWGKSLRQAVKTEDRDKFLELAASGTERIISQSQIKQQYAEPRIDFVEGNVYFSVQFEGREIKGRVGKYLTPEESIVQALKRENKNTRLIDPYTRDTKISIDEINYLLVYDSVEFLNGDEQIKYYFKPDFT